MDLENIIFARFAWLATFEGLHPPHILVDLFVWVWKLPLCDLFILCIVYFVFFARFRAFDDKLFGISR